ncbi:MAG TPA: cyclic nucleotide-binding domain-containing protein [Spirochaetales bacterium]|nr:cyclic nucleotide-binding domain-containing protein [Spirochaetales bacterium]
MAKDAELLRRTSLLDGLSSDAVALVLASGSFVRFKAGETVMHEGEKSDTMYLFLEGDVDVTKDLTLKISGKGFGHAEKSMTRLRAGTAPVFGEMSMFSDEPRSATVGAASDCVFFEVTRRSFEAICARDPRLGLELTRRIAVMLASRVRKGNDDVLKLSTALSIALSR